MSSTTYPATSILAPPTEADASAPRRAMIDLVRLVAAYGIVWLHTPRAPGLEASRALGRFAVPFFIFCAVYLVFEGLRRDPRRTFVQYARARFLQIYVPFLAWSGVYLSFKLTKRLLVPEQPNDFPGIEILWVGGFYHLWFMPFILVVSLLAFMLGKMTVARNRLELTVGAAASVAGLLLAITPTVRIIAPDDVSGRLAVDALPAVCWAVALGVLLRRPAGRCLEGPIAAIVGLALATGATAWMWRFGDAKLAATLGGLGFMLVALVPVRLPCIARLARLGPLAYGIYLSHMLFIKILEALAAYWGAHVTWQLDVGVFVAAAGLSTFLAWGLSRWPRKRQIIESLPAGVSPEPAARPSHRD